MMATEMTIPSLELATRILGEAGFEDRLVGVKIAQMGGANPTGLYTLADAAAFLKIDSYDELVGSVGRATVGYIEPKALASWVSGVFGDEELAEAIRAEAERSEFYAQTVEPIKALLESRLSQCREVVGVAEPA